MKRFALAAVLALTMISTIQAGPLGLFRRGSNTTNNNVTYNQPRHPVANAFLGSAQGAANFMAQTLRMAHNGNPTGGYEGVGMGTSPQSAISNCCYYGRRPLRDSGVAQGANGIWYACCRYN